MNFAISVVFVVFLLTGSSDAGILKNMFRKVTGTKDAEETSTVAPTQLTFHNDAQGYLSGPRDSTVTESGRNVKNGDSVIVQMYETEHGGFVFTAKGKSCEVSRLEGKSELSCDKQKCKQHNNVTWICGQDVCTIKESSKKASCQTDAREIISAPERDPCPSGQRKALSGKCRDYF